MTAQRRRHIVDMQKELRRTHPDLVTYVPRSVDGSTHDTGNEHFLVFEGPQDTLMAVWTQSSHEGAGDHRIVFAKSPDRGKTWTEPLRLAGCPEPGEGLQASWGFPLVSRSGRIYVLYNQFTGKADYHHQITGRMDAVYSDDAGATWSEPRTIPMPKSPRYDHPDPAMPSNWIVWQRPDRIADGVYLVGFTRWVSPEKRRPPVTDSWTAAEAVVEFMRFDNVDEDPFPENLAITYSAWNDHALRVPHYLDPRLSIAQEPSLVPLPDGRLFCTMRTMTGMIWYSLSADCGESWCPPRPLLRHDHGEPIREPLCCCPIYRLADGRYVLLHHNNHGVVQGCRPEETKKNRRPAFLALGEFRQNAHQPIWFSESKQFMDNDGVGIGPLERTDIGVYSSFTVRDGDNILWHPDRKFFLVGKRVSAAFLQDLKVPEAPAPSTNARLDGVSVSKGRSNRTSEA